MVLALLNKHLISALLTFGGWWEWKSRHWSVCVGLCYKCHFSKDKPAFTCIFHTLESENPHLFHDCASREALAKQHAIAGDESIWFLCFLMLDTAGNLIDSTFQLVIVQ